MAKLSELVVGTSSVPGLSGGMPYDLDNFNSVLPGVASSVPYIGETIGKYVSGVSLTSGAFTTLTSINLPRGLWLVQSNATLLCPVGETSITLSPSAVRRVFFGHFWQAQGNPALYASLVGFTTTSGEYSGTYEALPNRQTLTVHQQSLIFSDGVSTLYNRTPQLVQKSDNLNLYLRITVDFTNANPIEVQAGMVATRIA